LLGVNGLDNLLCHIHTYNGASKIFQIESKTKYMLTTINAQVATQNVMVAKLTKIYSQNSDTTAPSSKELYHLQFSLQASSGMSQDFLKHTYYP